VGKAEDDEERARNAAEIKRLQEEKERLEKMRDDLLKGKGPHQN
jgi:hypothetical protein